MLLDLVDSGEEVLITRNGRPAAKLVSVASVPDVETARAAARRIRELAKEQKLGAFDWEGWKAYSDEGRR